MWLKGAEEDLGISRLDLCMHTAEDSRQKWKQSDLVKRASAAKAQQAPVPVNYFCAPRGYFEHTKVFYINGNSVLSIKL